MYLCDLDDIYECNIKEVTSVASGAYPGISDVGDQLHIQTFGDQFYVLTDDNEMNKIQWYKRGEWGFGWCGLHISLLEKGIYWMDDNLKNTLLHEITMTDMSCKCF